MGQHYLGKIHLRNKRQSSAKKELKKAERVVDEISSKMSDELRKTYLAKEEVKDLYKDLSRVKMGSSDQKKKKEKGKGGKGG